MGIGYNSHQRVFQKTKIYEGLYEIRDYEREALLKNGWGCRFELGEFDKEGMFKCSEVMSVPLSRIKEMKVTNQVKGEKSGMTYLMYGIKWEGKKVIRRDNLSILNDFSLMSKLRERLK